MKKKMLISFLSSLMLITTVSSTAVMADDETKVTTLTYTISESYAWTIHPAVDFGKNAGAGKTITKGSNTVSVTKCILEDGNSLHISVVGSGTDGAFTINNGGTEVLNYTIKSGSNNITTGGDVLTVESGENISSTDMTFTLATTTSKTNEVAGTYSGTVTYTAEIKPSNRIGCYADIDGDGTVDGVIFADLAFSKSGTWNTYDTSDSTYNNRGTYSYSAQTNLKQYYISQESYEGKFGTAAVISPVSGTTGNDRFYVMALSNFTTSSYSTWYWYYSAYSTKISDYSTITSQNFGSGKQNTANMISKWNSSAYGSQNARDIWGAIQTQVENGWFVPSRAEWAAFADAFSITSNYNGSGSYTGGGNYDSTYGLSSYCWSSSLGSANNAYLTNFLNGYIIHGNVSYYYCVRLATTF